MSMEIRVIEEEVLGAMMLHPRIVPDVAAKIEGKDYSCIQHEMIHSAIVDLSRSGIDINPISVHGAVAAHGDFYAESVMLSDLHLMIGRVSTADTAIYYATRIRDEADRRSVASIGERLLSLAAVGGDEPLEMLNVARSEIDGMVTSRARDGSTSMASVVGEALESLKHVDSIRTPWRDFNRTFSGWRPGHLYLIGARPSVGKSALIGNIALHTARLRKGAVVMFSLEMPKAEFALRLMADMGSVDGQRILHRSTRPDDDERLEVAARELSLLPLVIEDEPGVTLAQIESRVRAIQANQPVALVLIDYLQILGQSRGAAKDRHVQVGQDAQGLKDMSKRLSVPVVAAAQLNRQIEGRAVASPVMSDLRESGGIEAAGDVIMLLHRISMAQEIEGLGDSTDLEVNIAKNRQGPQDLVRLKYAGEHFRFTDREFHGAPA